MGRARGLSEGQNGRQGGRRKGGKAQGVRHQRGTGREEGMRASKCEGREGQGVMEGKGPQDAREVSRKYKYKYTI
jgi:hypothetical protein